MKIALVIREFWPLKGGLTLHALRLCQHLLAAGHDVRVLTRFAEVRPGGNDFFWVSEPGRRYEIEGVPTEVIPLNLCERLFLLPLKKLRWRKSTQSLAIQMVNFVFVRKFLRRLRGVDLVHYDGGGLEMMGFAVFEACRRLGIPLVIQPSVHFGQWGHLPVDHRFFRLADRVLAHTEVEKRYLVEDVRLQGETVDVVLNGIDDPKGGDGAAFRRRYAIQGRMILFLGRKTHDKGYPLLRAAFRRIQSTVPDVCVVFIGPTDPGVAKPESSERMIELDYVSDDERNDALAACDVFCVPSEGESFGLVFVEALRCDKPVVCRRLAVLEELIGASPTVRFVGERMPDGTVPLDPVELVDTLVEVLSSGGENNGTGSETDRFLWENVTPRFLASYRKAVHR